MRGLLFFVPQALIFFSICVIIKATPHKARLKALYWICLHIFRHLAQKFLDIRQYACGISIQSDEKSVGASPAQALCGIALNNPDDIIAFPAGFFKLFRHEKQA